MKPHLSWIDPQRWPALMEALAPASPAPAFAPAFARASDSALLSALRTAAPQALTLVAPATLALVVPPAFEPPTGTLEARLHAFIAWTNGATPCRSVFVADEHGLPLLAHRADPVHVAVFSASLLNLLARIRGSGGPERGRIRVGLDPGGVLHIVEAVTVWGRYAVGLVADDALPEASLRCVQQNLERTFAERTEVQTW